MSTGEQNKSTEFQRNESFYTNAKLYWASIDPTIDGMLGGFGDLSLSDIYSSDQFLKEIFKMKPAPNRQNALDCGAGIGRVTKHLLMPLFNLIDMVEQQSEFADKAHEYLNDTQKKLGTIYNVGLQDFTPDEYKYDLIWCQWVLGHLRDEDFVIFFQRCAKGLTSNGVIIIKENVTSTDDCYIDEKDSSVTRSLKNTKSLLNASGLRIFKMVREKYFIQSLFPVYFIACRPMKK